MSRWLITAVGAVAAAALYAVVAIVFGDVSVGTAIVGSILFGGVGAMVTGVFAAGTARRRQPRV